MHYKKHRLGQGAFPLTTAQPEVGGNGEFSEHVYTIIKKKKVKITSFPSLLLLQTTPTKTEIETKHTHTHTLTVCAEEWPIPVKTRKEKREKENIENEYSDVNKTTTK